MTPQSKALLELAARVVAPYTTLPSIVAAMVTGSSAKGIADEFSDLDMTMYYDGDLPSEEDLRVLRESHGALARKWIIGDRASGSFAEAYVVERVEVQIGHTTVAAWEESIAEVLEGLDCTSPAQKALEGTLACRALYGEAHVERWKARIRAYPRPLGEAMVKKHLGFFPIWGLEHQFCTRDATIWYHEMLVQAAQNLVGILAGLNGLYFTTFQFKRMGRFLDAMTICPPELGPRVESLFRDDPGRAGSTLESLVRETLALVDEHMPSIDTAAARARLGWRQQPWTDRPHATSPG